MREIKFRAWDKNSEYMHSNVQSGVYEDPDEWTDFDVVLGLERFEVMQYTGLKDKNGKEIYEGDIVRVREDEDFIWTEQVLENGGGYWVDENYLGAIHSFCEVIGNIYENPELLGDSK